MMKRRASFLMRSRLPSASEGTKNFLTTLCSTGFNNFGESQDFDLAPRARNLGLQYNLSAIPAPIAPSYDSPREFEVS